MIGIPQFDNLPYTTKNGMLTDAASSNLTQIYNRLQGYQNPLVSTDSAPQKLLVPDQNTIAMNAASETYPLPTTCQVGQILTMIAAPPTPGFVITANAGQTIYYLATTGTTLTGTQTGGAVQLFCFTQDKDFLALYITGTFTLT